MIKTNKRSFINDQLKDFFFKEHFMTVRFLLKFCNELEKD